MSSSASTGLRATAAWMPPTNERTALRSTAIGASSLTSTLPPVSSRQPRSTTLPSRPASWARRTARRRSRRTPASWAVSEKVRSPTRDAGARAWRAAPMRARSRAIACSSVRPPTAMPPTVVPLASLSEARESASATAAKARPSTAMGSRMRRRRRDIGRRGRGRRGARPERASVAGARGTNARMRAMGGFLAPNRMSGTRVGRPQSGHPGTVPAKTDLPPALNALLDVGLGLVRRAPSARLAIVRAGGILEPEALTDRVREVVEAEVEAARASVCVPLAAKEVEQILKAAWGGAPAKVLDEFEPEPFAAHRRRPGAPRRSTTARRSSSRSAAPGSSGRSATTSALLDVARRAAARRVPEPRRRRGPARRARAGARRAGLRARGLDPAARRPRAARRRRRDGPAAAARPLDLRRPRLRARRGHDARRRRAPRRPRRRGPGAHRRRSAPPRSTRASRRSTCARSHVVVGPGDELALLGMGTSAPGRPRPRRAGARRSSTRWPRGDADAFGARVAASGVLGADAGRRRARRPARHRRPARRRPGGARRRGDPRARRARVERRARRSRASRARPRRTRGPRARPDARPARRGAVAPRRARGLGYAHPMSDLSRRPGNRLGRRERVDRAYQLVVAGGTAGAVAVVTGVLAVVGVLGWSLPMHRAARRDRLLPAVPAHRQPVSALTPTARRHSTVRPEVIHRATSWRAERPTTGACRGPSPRGTRRCSALPPCPPGPSPVAGSPACGGGSSRSSPIAALGLVGQRVMTLAAEARDARSTAALAQELSTDVILSDDLAGLREDVKVLRGIEPGDEDVRLLSAELWLPKAERGTEKSVRRSAALARAIEERFSASADEQRGQRPQRRPAHGRPRPAARRPAALELLVAPQRRAGRAARPPLPLARPERVGPHPRRRRRRRRSPSARRSSRRCSAATPTSCSARRSPRSCTPTTRCRSTTTGVVCSWRAAHADGTWVDVESTAHRPARGRLRRRHRARRPRRPRAQGVRAAAPPRRVPRRAHRACRTARSSRTASATRWPTRAAAARASRCCSSTSTTSRPSTTRSATRSATSCCA